MSIKNCFILFFLLVSSKIYSQNSTKKLFHIDKYLVTSNEKNFEYIKEIEDYDSDKKKYPIKIHYKSGKIYLIGTTLNKDKVILDGNCLYYYENGKRKRLANYENNILINKQYYYHENGVLKLESEFEVSKNKNQLILSSMR